MEVTLSGIETEVRLEQLRKAESPMEVTPAGIETEVSLEQTKKV